MGTSRVLESNNGTVIVEFDGTQVGKYWKDIYLVHAVDTASQESNDSDLFKRANLIFSSVNNAVRRHYSGQELMLKEVTVWDEDGSSIIVSR
jgi:hypothetical protein